MHTVLIEKEDETPSICIEEMYTYFITPSIRRKM
jgi:hypothetical protein